MSKLFDLAKLKLSDKKIESNIKKIDKKYSAKTEPLGLSFKRNTTVTPDEVEKSKKSLEEFSKKLYNEFIKAIDARSYKGYDDKNSTCKNLTKITNILGEVGNNPKYSVSDVESVLKNIESAKKGFLSKPKVKDILLRIFILLYKNFL